MSGTRRGHHGMRRGRRPLGRAATSLAGAALLLAGCGAEGSNVELLRRLSGEAIASVVGPDEDAQARARPPTRAEINAFDAAMIGVSADGSPMALFVAVAANPEGTVTYLSATDQSIALKGAALVNGHSLGDERTGYRSDPVEDFLVVPRPVYEWPRQLTRVMRFLDGLGKPFARTFLCAPRAIGPARIVIAEVAFDVIEVEETCRSPYRTIVNRYWAEEESGFVWKSRQWFGPERGTLEISILTPYN